MRVFGLLFVAALSALPGTVSAQLMPTRVRHAEGLTFELSDGEPISFFLEHARELELTDTQRASLIEMRRRLRQNNAPFMRQLDSLREALGVSLAPRPSLSKADVEALQRFEKLSQPIADSMRVFNQAAQAEARLLLLERQIVKLDSVVASERRGVDGAGRRGGRPPPN